MNQFLSSGQLSHFNENGYLILDRFLDRNTLSLLGEETERLFNADTPGKVLEADGVSVRSVNGVNSFNEVMNDLPRQPKLLDIAKQILNDEVYVHQYKINAKRGLVV